MHDLFTAANASAIPVHPTTTSALDATLASISATALARTHKFAARDGETLIVTNPEGAPTAVVLGLGDGSNPFALSALTRTLPPGDYALTALPDGVDAELAALAWLLGDYQFDRYKQGENDAERARLALPKGVDATAVERLFTAICLVRDLVNIPANDLGPAELEAAAREIADANGAKCSVILDDALLTEGFPLVHAVGRGSIRRPRLIDLRWGDENAPKLTLVGKGVCFDTGGLNLKTGKSMAKMKKDMGGAAHVLALAQLIMGAGLKVRLRVLVPAVENSVGADAFRPGDVFPSRSGRSVEIGNTDAEGRLVLADALTYADEESPELLIDMATLTGAARVALGPDLPPFFTDDEAFAADLIQHSLQQQDPVWRMPLWAGYRSFLDSKIADISHISSVPQGGAMTAALFLQTFVENAKTWVHLDVYAWNERARPGHSHGAAAHALRALFALLQKRYS